MARAVDDAAGDQLGESRSFIGILRGRPAESVAAAVEGDRGRFNPRTFGELPFDLDEPRFTGRIADAVTIRVDHHIDEIGIVERRCGLLVGLVRELPRRRPRFPQEPADRAAIALEADTTALGVEVVLIPERALALRRGGRWSAENVLNGIAADEDGGAHAIRMERRGNASRAAAPVVTGDGKSPDLQRIGEINNVLADRGLLRHARRGRVAESRRSIAA